MNAQESDYPREFSEFIRLFNSRQYFEAHEVLEDLWRVETAEIRRFYQGMIQIAAVFVHLNKTNDYGARELYGKAVTNLKGFGPLCMGIDVKQLLIDIGQCVKDKKKDYKIELHK